MVKVIDIFAGPGGLSEGFAALTDKSGNSIFDIVLSIEKDEQAYETLRLRTLFRLFTKHISIAYYRLLRGEINLAQLYGAFPAELALATNRCWHATLGPGGEPAETVHHKIKKAIGNQTSWVLIGGPPCQAYSIAGRSRNQGNPDYNPINDVRQRLYVEYLQILAEHRPAIFILENVKGLLSATIENESIFHHIIEDLHNPSAAIIREGRSKKYLTTVKYNIHSLTEDSLFGNDLLKSFVIQSEKYGIPQARHRVILLGVRDDIGNINPGKLTPQKMVSVSSVLNGLPPLRSGLSSTRIDSAKIWKECLQSQVDSRWANSGTQKVGGERLRSLIHQKLKNIVSPVADRGSEFLPLDVSIEYKADWFCDNQIGGICNHSSRAHMRTDLFRYFYAACFAIHFNKSPSLKDFPTDLLPNHESIDKALENSSYFSDRFRVQIASRPSTTIVSHISKDGHYYIHPDPLQCRSLTVREAARLQTFPDNYLFCGNRTAQYTQVGNAVPPLLAFQISRIVSQLIETAGVND